MFIKKNNLILMSGSGITMQYQLVFGVLKYSLNVFTIILIIMNYDFYSEYFPVVSYFDSTIGARF